MSEAVERILCEVFKAQGLKNPGTAAHRAALDFDRAKRKERIYDATAHSTNAEVAEAFGISERRVEQIVKEYLLTRNKIA